MSAFDKAFALIRLREGGDTNDPDDPGGLTRFGIAQKMHPEIDVANLDEAKAKEFYAEEYWNRIQLDKVAELSERLAIKLFDISVSQGKTRAQAWLQFAVDPTGRYVAHDGRIGKQTIEALRFYLDERGDAGLMESVRISSMRQRISRVKEHPPSLKYLEGWILRSLDKDGRFN